MAIKHWWVLKMCNSRPLFPYFHLFKVYSNMLIMKFCGCLKSNHGPLILEATALPTEPQPLPKCCSWKFIRSRVMQYLTLLCGINQLQT